MHIYWSCTVLRIILAEVRWTQGQMSATSDIKALLLALNRVVAASVRVQRYAKIKNIPEGAQWNAGTLFAHVLVFGCLSVWLNWQFSPVFVNGHSNTPCSARQYLSAFGDAVGSGWKYVKSNPEAPVTVQIDHVIDEVTALTKECTADVTHSRSLNAETSKFSSDFLLRDKTSPPVSGRSDPRYEHTNTNTSADVSMRDNSSSSPPNPSDLNEPIAPQSPAHTSNLNINDINQQYLHQSLHDSIPRKTDQQVWFCLYLVLAKMTYLPLQFLFPLCLHKFYSYEIVREKEKFLCGGSQDSSNMEVSPFENLYADP